MAKQIKQYRYYGETINADKTISPSPNNYPVGLTLDGLCSGAAFETRISDLRIQAYPGTKFYLNDSDAPVLIGSSGEYTLGLGGNYEITSLRFDRQCLNTYYGAYAAGGGIAYLIVDIVYNTSEE